MINLRYKYKYFIEFLILLVFNTHDTMTGFNINTTLYYTALLDIIEDIDSSLERKVVLLVKILHSIFNEEVKTENQRFSTNYAAIIFIADKYKFPKELLFKINSFVRFARNGKKRISSQNTELVFNYGVYTIARLLAFFDGKPYPDIIADYLINIDLAAFDQFERVSKYEKHEMAQLIVTGKLVGASTSNLEYAELKCSSEELGDVRLRLYDFWKPLAQIIWIGCSLNAVNCRLNQAKSIILYAGSDSLIVLEPDLIVDVTEIAECFNNGSKNPYYYFFKKYLLRKTSGAAVLGNIVNYLFDVIITSVQENAISRQENEQQSDTSQNTDTKLNFATVFDSVLMVKPLQIIALMNENAGAVAELRSSAFSHFNRLLGIAKTLEMDEAYIEPTFISPLFGIQGRLDLLLEYRSEPKIKNLIELKSGKAPNPNYTYPDDSGFSLPVGMWSNHLAQVTAYNLLLDSVYRGRSGYSAILYSDAESSPLRNAPNIQYYKRDIIALRNQIIALERAVAEGFSTLYNELSPKSKYTFPSYNSESLACFNACYSGAKDESRDYFCEMSAFLQREIYSAKIGSGNHHTGSGYGFSSLWRESLEEKAYAGTALTNLRIDLEGSDFSHNYFLLFTQEPLSFGNFRKGDIIILRKQNIEAEAIDDKILRGVIIDVTKNSIKISLRNKMFLPDKDIAASLWAVEADYMESTAKGPFQSLYRFLSSPTEKQELLLGMSQPVFSNILPETPLYLNTSQAEVFKAAVSAENYYLIQGPPGTGKTSYLLKALVEHYFVNTNDNILLLTFTNRAADEICSAISTIAGCFDYLRLGAKDTSPFSDNMISYLSEKMNIDELFERISKTRVFVSTVASALSTPELFEIKRFSILIADEASQILEPWLIGIIADICKFILIGDEKQLPAVVTQNVNKRSINSQTLRQIGITDCSMSLFERLLRQCRRNGWQQAFGMITKQARMHSDIQMLANSLFYNNCLETLEAHNWQTSKESLFDIDSGNPFHMALATKRVLFVNTPKEKRTLTNSAEAAVAADIGAFFHERLGDSFNPKSIGIVAPFRAQCSEIALRVPSDLSRLITVDTIERFQGSERDVIIISFAANSEVSLQKISSTVDLDGIVVDRKLNVAITRAKKYLIIIGCAEILAQSLTLNRMLELIKSHGSWLQANDFLSYLKNTVNIKVAFDHFQV